MSEDTMRDNAQTTYALHKSLIDQVKARGHIVSRQVEAAFRAVPRHLFLQDLSPQAVYQDKAIVTKVANGHVVSSSSQPTIMAIMLEQLDLHKGQRVLEIGAGTGYNAALMAHIVGEDGLVITIDIDEDIVEGARKNLTSTGFERVKVVCADGGLGWAEAAPYDRIILTVNAGDITPAWHEQLAPAGRLLLPFGVRGPQIAVAFKREQDHLESISVQPCGFIGLRGAFAEQGLQLQLDPEPGLLYLTLGEPRSVDAHVVAQWLQEKQEDVATSVHLTTQELFGGLGFWLALHEPRFCSLTAQRAAIKYGIVPNLFPSLANIPTCTTLGILGEDALSVLAYTIDTTAANLSKEKLQLVVRTFGNATHVAQTLVSLIQNWDAAGRPNERNLHISAYRTTHTLAPTPQETVIKRQATQFLFRW